MSSNINLLQYMDSLVTPKHDALVNDLSTCGNGIIYGCEVTIKNATTLHINAGMGIAYGREFEVFDSDITVGLSSSGNLNARLYIHIDLGNTTTPIQLLVEQAATLSDLDDDPNINIDNGQTDMELAIFTVGISAISDITNTFIAVEKVREKFAQINNNLSAKADGTVLWTNPNPAIAFDEQSVNLSESLTDYTKIEILYKVNANAQYLKSTGKILLVAGLVPVLDFSSDYNYFRYIVTITTSLVKFGKGQYYNNNVASAINAACVPYKIIGYK